MSNKKEFDCVQFKYELQQKTLQCSGAKNLREYVQYVNEIAKKSTLCKAAEPTKNANPIQRLTPAV